MPWLVGAANPTRASKRLEQVRVSWELTGADIARELGVEQPTASRLLNGRLLPGRSLAATIERLYLVPVAWWDLAPLEREREPVPNKPGRYPKHAHKRNGTDG